MGVLLHAELRRIRRASGGPYFWTAFLIEFALGFGGYFSDFKTVIILTLFAAYASGVRVSARSWIAMGAAVALLIGLGVVWSAIKADYRKLSQRRPAGRRS